MSNIREMVLDTMKEAGLSQYGEQPGVGQVISALEDRERWAVRNLIQFAMDKGLSRDQAVQAIEASGLEVDNVNPHADRISALETQIEDIQAELRTLRG